VSDNSKKSEPIDIAIRLASTIVGALPPALTGFDLYRISPLYQPFIYHGKEYFLIAPVAVALFASWSVLRYSHSMIVIFILFLLLIAGVYYLYEAFPDDHWIHPINWVLSFCAFALLVALCAGFLITISQIFGASPAKPL
jgi:hypothetical protein